MRKLVRPVMLGGLLLLAFLVLPAGAFAAPPAPAAFVKHLDVRCYTIPNQPALGINLQLNHLNPVLTGMGLPAENVTVGPPQDLCVPVRKNTQTVPADVLTYIRFVDWKCYAISGPPLNLSLALNQLNPVMANLVGATSNVIVREPQQICVPVYKNNAIPPPDVQELINYLDVKCYRIETSQNPAGKQLTLWHLNPLITNPPETVNFLGPAHQLCVPVKKNLQSPPPAVLPIIQYSDVLCYRTTGAPLNRNFTLTHLNPVLKAMGLPAESITTTNPSKVCVPVAKNGFFPPN